MPCTPPPAPSNATFPALRVGLNPKDAKLPLPPGTAVLVSTILVKTNCACAGPAAHRPKRTAKPRRGVPRLPFIKEVSFRERRKTRWDVYVEPVRQHGDVIEGYCKNCAKYRGRAHPRPKCAG